MNRTIRTSLTVGIILIVFQSGYSAPLGTGFTYQGQLKQGGTPLNGNVNLIFRLWSDLTSINPVDQVGVPQQLAGVEVVNGLFTVQLNSTGQFGPNAFNGEARWLEITVNNFVLSPRQQVAAAPYALHAPAQPAHSLSAPDGSPTDVVQVDNEGTIQIHSDVSFENDLESITFPPTSFPNSPMINMFSANTTNVDRMVIAHSPAFPNWGLLYKDSGDQFDFVQGPSTVMRIDLFQKRVGVGSTNLTERFQVGGNARADRFIYSDPREHAVSIPAPAFRPTDENTRFYNHGSAYLLDGEIGLLVSPVYFPSGAMVTSMRVYYRDESTHTLGVKLVASDFALHQGFDLATIDTSGAQGDADALDISIENAIINNLTRGYFVRIYDIAGPWGSDIFVWGVVITYTTTEAD